MSATVYLIPTVLAEGATGCLPPYLLEAITSCARLFVENERTARRYLKTLSKAVVIDAFQWHTITDATPATLAAFRQALQAGQTVGILSEAGCPGVADPGQELVALAQQLGAVVKPLVGPNSMLLALMGSGLNGQQFQFSGYLPIEAGARAKTIRQLEAESKANNRTQIFIETPYRNNQLLEALVKTCQPQTRICVAVDLTAPTESIQTKTAQQWKGHLPQLHKRPAIFLLLST